MHRLASKQRTEEELATVVLAIGLSAGAIAPLRTIVATLPSDLAAAMVIAQHAASPTRLPQLITCWGHGAVELACDGATLRRGTICVCPAGHHVTLNPDGTIGVSDADRVRFVRPSIDWLFESLAASYGARGVAVVLSGTGSDGARGARFAADAGGHVIVQDPESCEHQEMPMAALMTGMVNERLLAHEIGPLLGHHAERLARRAPTWPRPFG